MAAKRDQHKVGIPAKPRGQQMGVAGAPDQNREAKADTPAVSGRRKNANKMFADKSSQHVATDASKPSTNSPSIPAMNTAKRKGESGGERVFKARLKTKRAAKKP
jgi:hypothetical protein